MSFTSQELKKRYFSDDEHPYRIYESEIEKYLTGKEVLLDAGCGYTAEILKKFSNKASKLIGVELVEFDDNTEEKKLELHNCDLSNIPIEDDSVDLIISRSVFEHLEKPELVYAELNRVLKKGGHAVVLTANSWDYASIVSKLIPNRFHPWVVSRTEGRDERDTFPAFYRTNTRRKVELLSNASGFKVVDFKYLGQYPCYFMFNPFLFLIATGYEKLIGKYEVLKYLRGWILFTLQKK